MSDPRESPEWAEWERLLSDLLISARADEDSMPEDDGRYSDDLFDERHDALDAFVLRLLAERGELRNANARLKNDWTRMEANLPILEASRLFPAATASP